MSYNTFAQDAAVYGLSVARRWADYCGVSREQQLAWQEQLRAK